MQYTHRYESSLGGIFLTCDDEGLTGLWFDGQKYFAKGIDLEHEEREHPIFEQTCRWLDIYFSGQEPNFLPPLHLIGSPFRLGVWEVLCRIPYGKTMTYGEISQIIAQQKGLPHMSAQAVGGAVGHNPVSVIVPCHRVVGTNGSLTGYAGGVDKKIKLLELEQTDMSRLFVPTKGTAL